MKAEKPRFALYTRISRDPDGTSTAPARQEKDCRRLAKERGYQIVEVFTDTDLSAYQEGVQRPEYEAMLEAMKEGTLDGILVWKLDRLVRRIVEFSRFWKIASEHHVDLVSKNDPIDTTSPLGVGIMHMIVALAEQESANTSLRLRAKLEEAAKEGAPKARGRRVYGLSEGWAEIVPEEAAIIRECAERLLAGDTYTGIVRDLNRRGVPSASGGLWNRRSLQMLIKSARLFGWREHNGELVAKGDWPAILDEDTGTKLRDMVLNKPKTGTYTRRKSLLSGLLRCGRCGAKMTQNRAGDGARIYVCRSKQEGGCAGSSVRADAADEVVSGLVLHRLESPDVAAMLRSRTSANERKGKGDADAELLTRLAELRERAERIAGEVARGDISLDAYKLLQRALEGETDELNRQLSERRQAEPLRGVLDGHDGVTAAWETMSTDRRRAVMDAMLERVVVHNADSEYYITRLVASLEAEIADARARHAAAKAARKAVQQVLDGKWGPAIDATADQLAAVDGLAVDVVRLVEKRAGAATDPGELTAGQRAQLEEAVELLVPTVREAWNLARRRGWQLDKARGGHGGGGTFRPERLQPIWKG